MEGKLYTRVLSSVHRGRCSPQSDVVEAEPVVVRSSHLLFLSHLTWGWLWRELPSRLK